MSSKGFFIRKGFNVQMNLVAKLELSRMVLPEERSTQSSSRNRRDDSGKSSEGDESGGKCVVCGNMTTMKWHEMQFDNLQCPFWYHKCAN